MRENPIKQIQQVSKLLVVLLLLPILSSGILYGQDSSSLASVHLTAETEAKLTAAQVPLEQFLDKLEQTYRVTFLYQTDVVEDKFVNSQQVTLNQMTGDKLVQILTNLGLNYTLLDEQTYVLFEKDKNQALLKTQQETVSGTVTNDQTGEPISSVNIVVRGTNMGTTTNEEGYFSLRVPSLQDTLVFSFVGYQSEVVPIQGRTEINITLKPQTVMAEELVVVGYGKQKEQNITGAISSVSPEEIEDRPITHASQALRGVPGVYVNQTSAQPGESGATIRIRGVGTLGNNKPLVLVDGVEMSLRAINPNNIKSMTVLKDAAAAAIYGNRAANGVILVTTKSGRPGDVQVKYSNNFGLQQVTYLPNPVTNSVLYMKKKNLALKHTGLPPEYTHEQIVKYKNEADPSIEIYPNTDWMDLMFRTAPMQKHNLWISGGSEKVTYSVMMGYLNQEGVMIGTNAQKYSLSSKINVDISKNLTFGGKLTGSYWIKDEPAGGVGSVLNLTFRGLPIDYNKLADGRWGERWITVPGAAQRNPVALATQGFKKIKTQRILASLFAEYEFISGVNYKVKVAANKFDYLQERFVPIVKQYNPKALDEPGPATPSILDFIGGLSEGSSFRSNQTDLHLTFYQTVEWNENFGGKHNITLLLGNSIESFDESYFNAFAEGYFGNQLTALNAGALNHRVNGKSTKVNLVSLFGRLKYNFSNTYLVSANFRYDGSSRFAKGNRWGFFPSFAVGWRIGQEEFIKNISFIETLKLRASWGKLGNQKIGLYRYINTVELGHDYAFGGERTAGAAVTRLTDEDISWEVTTMTNIGLDASFFNGKLATTFDIFNKKTTGILRPVLIPAQVGNLVGPVRNIGEVVNKGFEFSLSYQNTIGDFSYNIGGNITYVQNEVTDLDGEIISSGRFRTKEGYPIDSYFLRDAIGIFQTKEQIKKHAFQSDRTQPGDIIYRDVNEDGVINSKDRVMYGSVVPSTTYAFNFGLKYKGFEFSANFQGVENVYTYLTLNLVWPFYNGAGVTKRWLKNSWTPDNRDASLPRLTIGGPKGYAENYKNSDFWLKDASYLRLKYIELAYTFPSSITDELNIGNLKLFIGAKNLLTFTKMEITDPERALRASTIYHYPSTKIYTMGINIKF